MKRNNIIPYGAMEKILKKSGASRISHNAKIALSNVLEEYAEKIATSAVRIAAHTGRKTVKEGDIKLASK